MLTLCEETRIEKNSTEVNHTSSAITTPQTCHVSTVRFLIAHTKQTTSQNHSRQLILTIHNNGAHDTGAPIRKFPTERTRRPTLSIGGSSEEWAYFTTRWADYVTATKIEGRPQVIQLLECCEEQLRKDLTRNAGGSLANMPIDDGMPAIKKLAVREENTMVARYELNNMRPDRDEPIRNFGARLRGQAGLCKFSIPCPSCNIDVDYTEHIIRDVVTRSLADNEIQLGLLGDKNQDMTHEEVLQFVEAKEGGKQSAGRLLESQTRAVRSQY